MRYFLIYTNRHKDKDLAVTHRIREFLAARDCRCTLREKGEPAVQGEAADCMLVLGGDGTMLQAAREAVMSPAPILGVNLGNLGYMTEVEPDNVEAALDQLLRGDYELENRMLLSAGVRTAGGEETEGWALNDVVITRSGPLKIIDFNIYVNGQFLNRYSADGVIVTTPTGSTGYNLSAGGPIVEPSARLMMITPICPHTLNQRSIILSPEDRVSIEIPGGREGCSQEVEISFDGAAQLKLHTGDEILITKSEKTIDFIKLSKVSFLEILHRKMSEN